MDNLFVDTMLDKVVANFKQTLKAKQRALMTGKYEDIKEFRKGVESHKDILKYYELATPNIFLF